MCETSETVLSKRALCAHLALLGASVAVVDPALTGWLSCAAAPSRSKKTTWELCRGLVAVSSKQSSRAEDTGWGWLNPTNPCGYGSEERFHLPAWTFVVKKQISPLQINLVVANIGAHRPLLLTWPYSLPELQKFFYSGHGLFCLIMPPLSWQPAFPPLLIPPMEDNPTHPCVCSLQAQQQWSECSEPVPHWLKIIQTAAAAAQLAKQKEEGCPLTKPSKGKQNKSKFLTLTAACLHCFSSRQSPATLARTGSRGLSFRSSHFRFCRQEW